MIEGVLDKDIYTFIPKINRKLPDFEKEHKIFESKLKKKKKKIEGT
jgi:hypothetical protein